MTLPFEIDDARRAAEGALASAGPDGVEVVVTGSHTGLTRFANSQIIQSTERRETRAFVRVVVGTRAAGAATTSLTPEDLERAAQRAYRAALAAPDDPAFPGLPEPSDVGVPAPLNRWDSGTADATPDRRATQVSEIVGAAGGVGAAGIVDTGAHAYAVFSTAGVDCADAYTRAVTQVLVDEDGATGWAEAMSSRADELDGVSLAVTARDIASRSRDPIAIEPGTYPVVLMPLATSILLEYLAWLGFGAKAVLEGESFLTTRAGEPVATPDVTIADDAAHRASLGIGFDFQGVPRGRVAVIDGGVATGPVTDWRTARLLGAELTGHSSGSDEWGPYAANPVLEPGDSSLEELIGRVDDGLLITRFHYVNVLDRPSTLLTGMTRDGFFRIRRGEVAEPVRNLRFSQSALGTLASCRGLGRELYTFAPESGAFGSNAAPALFSESFHFSSGVEA